MQPLPNYRGYTVTTTDANATTVIDVAAVMEEANRITFVVELGDLYVNFNGVAASDGSSMLVPAGTGYTEEEIRVTGLISIMRVAGTNGRIRGCVWGRQMTTTPHQFKSDEKVKLRLGFELMQPIDAFKPFTQTTSGASATTVLTVSDFMSEANHITLVADKADLYINFNGDATSDGTSMLVPAGTGYTEDFIRLTGKISIMRAGNHNGRVIGAVWGF